MSVSTAFGRSMEKRTPENPKYAHVGAHVNSGATARRQQDRIVEMKGHLNWGKSELFKRMKITTFVQLVVQVYNVDGMLHEDDPDRSEARQYIPEDVVPVNGVQHKNLEVLDTSRSTMHDVVQGIGQMDLGRPAPGMPSWHFNTSCPYLLMDVRPKDEYDECHIISAFSYPSSMLSRSVNSEIKEMLAFRNKPGCLIILYDNDEQTASQAATTLAERGYDNIFVIIGGLKTALKMFPKGLVTGVIPKYLIPQEPPKSSKKRLPPRKAPSVINSDPLSGVTPSIGSRPVDELVKIRSFADRENFTIDDILDLDAAIDDMYADKSVGTRLTSQATVSTRASSQAASKLKKELDAKVPPNLIGRPAFKA